MFLSLHVIFSLERYVVSGQFLERISGLSESKLFQHYHHSAICTNIRLWWQWSCEFYSKRQSLVDQTLKQDILVVESDWNAKVGEDLRRCLRTLLQSGDLWQRAQVLRLRNLQQPCAGKHPRQPYAIQKVDMAQPIWITSQPEWLHLGEETVPFRYQNCQNQNIPRCRCWKRPWYGMMTFQP